VEWIDNGYILSQKTFSEQALILDVFTKNHGRARGIVKGSRKKFLNSLQVGIGGKIVWKARLEEHLGNFTIDPQFNLLPFLYLTPSKLLLIQSLTTILRFTLPEKQPYPHFFSCFEDFLTKTLLKTDSIEVAKDYIQLEKNLLNTLGFALDITKCALTGSHEDLAYVSPKTGKACTKTSGEPYKDILLKLPDFLGLNTAIATQEDIKNGLHLTGHFLEKHFFMEKQKSFLSLRESISRSLTF